MSEKEVQRIEDFLCFLRPDLNIILDQRSDLVKNNKKPYKLVIPRLKFLGMWVEFGDVSAPKCVGVEP